MAIEFIGPMPVNDFLKEFMPPHSEPAPRVGNGLENAGSLEPAFINTVTRYKLCPSLKLVNTSGDDRDPKHSKPDISVFDREDVTEAGARRASQGKTKASGHINQQHPTHLPPKTASRKAARDLHMCFPILEMTIHFLLESDTHDPFTDSGFAGTDDGDDEAHIWRGTADANRNILRMAQHTSSQLSAQVRVFSFSIILFPNAYRLVRWDRVGAVATRRTCLRNDGQYLAEFLWRFSHMNPEQRGRDTTVCAPSGAEAALAQTFFESKDAREHLVDTDGNADAFLTTLHKFHIHDEHTNKDHYFVARPALWSSPDLLGRSTSGRFAYDLQAHRLVYLKDTWRADMPGYLPEGITYRLLHAHGVPYIAGLVCAGDVPGQRTRTQEFKAQPWALGKVRMGPLMHYRVVLDTIGRPLGTAKSSREICVSIRHAIESHWIAYSKAGILHRDISGGNILITKSKNEEGYEGLLIDWELCKFVAPKVAQPMCRTGTWQFMAAEIQMKPRTPHKLHHDLESFFYVLFYYILRFCRHSIPGLKQGFDRVFESRDWDEGLQTVTGGDHKRALFLGCIFRSRLLFAQFKAPLAQLICELRKSFSRLYPDEDCMGFSPEKYAAAVEFLSNSEGVMSIFDKHLEESDWHADDAGHDNLAENTKKRFPDGSGAQSQIKRVRLVNEGSEDS